MTGAIAIFVKTPGLSPVKTRLAASLGQEIAESFHLASAKTIADVAQTLSLSTDITPYFAVAEEPAMNHEYWKNLPRILQCEGGLGERMAHVYQTLLDQHDYVILVGADIPQMSTNDLLGATDWLNYSEQTRFAFAPSEDGGFWLFGGNHIIPSKIWTDVVYSTNTTGTQFYSHIEKLGEVKTLESLHDVDELKDLIPLYNSLTQLNNPIPAQKALIHFINTLSPEIIY